MAEGGAPMDNKAHQQTYSGFITMLKFSTVIVAVLTLIVILLIAG